MAQTFDWLAHRAQVSPQKVALIFEEQSWTYRELNTLVAEMAARLAAVGVEAGQHVAVLMPNRMETVCLIHALARLGAVLVPLNIRLTAAELGWQVEHAGCTLLICDAHTEAQAADLAHPGLMVVSVDAPQRPGSRWLNSFTGDAAQWQNRPLDLEAVQGIVFTSGTTGHPKGAMLAFANHFWSATASAYRLGTDPKDSWLACMPLYHVGGIAIIFRCCLYGTAVVLQSGFDAAAVGRAIESHSVTLLSVVPTMLHRLLESQADALGKLRCILLGGAAAPKPLLEKCRAMKLPVAATYGLTEAASQVATESLVHAGKPGSGRRPVGSVGQPLMFSQVRIVNSNGQDVLTGDIGEIVVSGPTVMRGYYNNPEATQKTLRYGRLHTGDLGYLDANGDLWVVLRRTDLIVSGGENVYPAEIEQVFEQHPDIEEVTVVGVDDAEWGQRVAAAIVPRRSDRTITEEELLDFSRDRLAGYKQPRMVRLVDKLPRTASGKIQRDKVKRLIELES